LEDFALRFTAKSARKWSAARVANTALGAISFLALEAIGGTITVSYGFSNSVAAICAVGFILFLTGLPISYYAARYGVDIDLLTRGAGFGYIGSVITSLIYATFTFIFFAIEAVIMSKALELCFGLPLPLGYLVSSLIVIPLVTHGITLISRLQLWTQPIWLVLHVLPFVFIALWGGHSLRDWTSFAGAFDGGGRFDLLLFGAASSVVFSLIAQIGEQVDFLRFLPPQGARPTLGWWAALIAGGPGWIVIGGAKLLAGSFLASLLVWHGLSFADAAEPTQMYRVAFRYVFSSPLAALVLSSAFVIVSQIKINVTNSYAGSIAWSNFFSRLTHRHPGRVVWLVFNVTIAFLLMDLGVYTALAQILGLYSIIAAAWVGALVADLVVNKPLQLSPPQIEFKRAHLYDVNPVGVGAMTIAAAIAISAFCGLFGEIARAFAPFVALASAFVSAPLIAIATGGRYYIARKPRQSWAAATSIECCICGHSFDPEDMAFCPAYAGPICSLCCSLDSRCHDSCKPSARLSTQAATLLAAILPKPMAARLNSGLGRYLAVLAILAVVIGIILMVIFAQATIDSAASREVLRVSLWRVFFVLMIIAGIGAWLFVLAQESRKVAEEESRHQTTLLMREIRAHRRTDAKLQKAKEVAEAANLAKTRYVFGISHELRTPLNAIVGYAQLLEKDRAIPAHRRDAIKIMRRSGEHLASLIEGLLDVSKIEAGRLHLFRAEVRIAELLDQIVDMFRLQAMAKSIDFVFVRQESLPEVVYTDEKRLRQVIINLLSNALKFTESGRVALRVGYRSQIAHIEVEDTGIGIEPKDLERIFEPFERVHRAGLATKPGIGLGLTITKLLAEIMGGEISVQSEPGRGSRFLVKLMLSAVPSPTPLPPPESQIYGYLGPRLTVLVADDDPTHRDMIREILTPLGFIVFDAIDGPDCLSVAAQCRPDLFLLDISMPGLDGWRVAQRLRQSGHDRAAIIMVSANAQEVAVDPKSPHNEYVIKPIEIRQLLTKIGDVLRVEWLYGSPDMEQAAVPGQSLALADPPLQHHLDELRMLGRIGYVRGIRRKLEEIESEGGGHGQFVSEMRSLMVDFDIDRYMTTLETLADNDAAT
jgi:signal transduction histidine kinase/DNA-binding NarL/FixJ family response regulator